MSKAVFVFHGNLVDRKRDSGSCMFVRTKPDIFPEGMPDYNPMTYLEDNIHSDWIATFPFADGNICYDGEPIVSDHLVLDIEQPDEINDRKVVIEIGRHINAEGIIHCWGYYEDDWNEGWHWQNFIIGMEPKKYSWHSGDQLAKMSIKNNNMLAIFQWLFDELGIDRKGFMPISIQVLSAKAKVAVA